MSETTPELDLQPDPASTRAEAWVSDRLCDGVVFAFSGWTLICHATVFVGGSLHQLLAVAALCIAAWLVSLRWRRTRRTDAGRPPSSDPAGSRKPEAVKAAVPIRTYVRWWLSSTAIVGVITYAVSGNLTAVWVIGVIGLLPAGLTELCSEPQFTPVSPRRSWTTTLWVLCGLCAVLTLVAHRPDSDDHIYVNLAVTVADHPAQPIMAHDSLHGLQEMQSTLLRIFRVHTLEVFEGAVSYLTGLHVLDVAHWIIPALAALMLPLASARLLRLLIPGRWIWGLVVTLAILLMVGNSHRIYGNFAFVRLHQGKAILLSVMVPLLIVYGLEFALRPDRKRWLRLAAGQIAAVGLSSTGLWVAPVVAGLAVVCGVNLRRRPLRTLLLGASSSIYVVCLALCMSHSVYGDELHPMRSGVLIPAAKNLRDLCNDDPRCLELITQTREQSARLWFDPDSVPAEEQIALRKKLRAFLGKGSNPRLMAMTLERVLGQGSLVLLWLLVIFGGWALAQTPAQRRFLNIFPLGFLLMWNPFWMSWIVANITGRSISWRVFWVLPLPLILGVVLTMPIQARALRGLPARIRIVVVLMLALALVHWCTTTPVPSEINHVRLGFPEWKVPRDDFSVACFVNEQVPAGSFVLAPENIAVWMTTNHRHPYPLLVRMSSLGRLRNQLGDEEILRRIRLESLVSGAAQEPSAGEELRQAVHQYPLEAVCLALSAATPKVRSALAKAGLSRTATTPRYEIWSRPDSSRREADLPRFKRCRMGPPSGLVREAIGTD